MTTRDQYVAKMKSEIDDMNARIDKLATRSKSAKKDMSAKYKQEMAELRVQSSNASAQLDRLKAAGDDTWEGLVAELERIGGAFKHSYNYLKSQL